MFALAFLAAHMLSPDPATALDAYLKRPQPAFSWHEVSRKIAFSMKEIELKMVSQTWHGHKWTHDLLLVEPLDSTRLASVAWLVITGDRVDRVDVPFARKLAEASKLPVATLFNVPNQPLYGRREDDLIAYTFEQYLETGDPTWPLLLPMVESVIRAMDVITRQTGGRIEHFLLTGESKRGWTTWLAAASGDPRINLIAPVAFDNLDIGAQLAHQMVSWGHLSEMLQSYTGPGLTEQAASEKGKDLLRIVDPYGYLKRIHIPIFMIRGSNDPFWTADAAHLYWDRVKEPKGLLVLPNEGHDFGDDGLYIRSLAQAGLAFGNPSELECWASFDGAFHCHWRTPIKRLELWRAEASNKDFRSSRWKRVSTKQVRASHSEKGECIMEAPAPASGFAAYFVQFYKPDGAAQSSLVEIISSKVGAVSH